MTLFKKIFTIITLIFGSMFTISSCAPPKPDAAALSFDGQRALADIERQLSFGPRIPESEAHTQFVDWLQGELASAGWEVQVQEDIQLGHALQNVIATRGSGQPWIVLGAHYDSRIFADQDPVESNQSQPVPGANDGASGVAVLLELARVLPDDYPAKITLVFFDAEDNGDIDSWDWILGSRVFVESLENQPDAVVIVDMIGDADLEIYRERNSDFELVAEIWGQADVLGHADQFIITPKYSMLDDHTPFVMAGIPTVLLIDFDYAYWHTTADTLDKVSAESLQIVGDTLFRWLLSVCPEIASDFLMAPTGQTLSIVRLKNLAISE